MKYASILVWSFLLLASTTQLFSQKKQLTIEEAVIGQYRELYPKYINNIRWKDANGFTYVKDYNSLWYEKTKQGKAESLFTLDQLNGMYHKAGLDSLGYLVSVNWINPNQFIIHQDAQLVIVDAKNKSVAKSYVLDPKAENVEYQEVSGIVAYTVENNLYIHNGKEAIAVTNDTDKGIVNGQTVHRNEFGISGGIFWSPKGKLLAYYHKDESMVTNYPLVDVTTRIAEVNTTRYPMAGMKSEEVLLAVYNPATNRSIYLETGLPKEQYLTNIAWCPDESTIYIQVLNREQNHMKLNAYDAVSGKLIKTLFEEKNEKYVEPEHPIIFLKNDAKQFLFFSEQDGYQHLYLYNTDGQLIKQLTKGNWIVTDFEGFDLSGQKVLFMATVNGPLEKQLFSVDIQSGEMKCLTPDKGQHSAFVNTYADVFVDGYSSMTVPHDYYVRDFAGQTIREIQKAENPLADYELADITVNTIKSADGTTDLYYRLISPKNIDKSKKYPAIVYVYGGPHAQLIDNSWLASADMWMLYMAQKGYVILTVDGRGSANRGFEFESIIHRNVGVAEMADQMKGIDLLKSLGYVDMERIGVDGWSYGGFMTTNLILSYPDVFKVATAGGPVIDWKYYEVMYGERYMDTPEENPEGYKNSCLINKVDQLKGRLLIIHGSQDPTVVWQNSQAFLNQCIKKGKLLDYFIYPNHEHNVGGKDRIHLMRKITQYYEDFL